MNIVTIFHKILILFLLNWIFSCADSSPSGTTPLDNSDPLNESVPFNVGKISFTFDDGVESIYDYALPIFKTRGVSATAYIATDWIEETGYMTWPQVQSLQNDQNWEIGSHTVSHAELPLLSDIDINKELTESKDILVAKGLRVSSFAAPYGAYDDRVLNTSSRNYAQHRGFWDRDDLNSFPYNNTVLMVESVDRDTISSDVFALIDRAINERKWLILVFHEVLPDTISDYIYTTLPEELEKMVDYALASGIEIVLPNHTLSFDTYNLVTKQNETNDWTMDSENIEIAPMNSGQYPHVTDAFLFNGEENDIHLYSPKIYIDINKSYRFKCFVDTLQLTLGEFGFYFDEYDENDQWLAGGNHGIIGSNKITEVLSSYKPQNSQTVYVKIQSYLSGGSIGQVISDHYQLYQLDE